jgi:hypothetical protein
LLTEYFNRLILAHHEYPKITSNLLSADPRVPQMASVLGRPKQLVVVVPVGTELGLRLGSELNVHFALGRVFNFDFRLTVLRPSSPLFCSVTHGVRRFARLFRASDISKPDNLSAKLHKQ